MIKKSVVLAGLGLLAGCFTISQTEFPAVQLSKAVTPHKIAVEGFLATIVNYTPIYTTQTYVGGGHYVHGPYGPRYVMPHVGAYTTESLVPTVQNTDVFQRRAMDALERAGYILRAAPADYTVSAEFIGPITHPDSFAYGCETFFSLTFLFRAGTMWNSHLKIYDNKTGQVVFAQDYAQAFDSHGWSPLPLFGWADYVPNHESYMKNWCLDALTDRMCADASAFLSQKK